MNAATLEIEKPHHHEQSNPSTSELFDPTIATEAPIFVRCSAKSI